MWDRYRKLKPAAATVLIVVAASVLSGCGNGPPTTGAYRAECQPTQLLPGRRQEVELTVHYLLPANPPSMTTVSYQAQVSAPQGWSVTSDRWEFSHRLKTTDIGFRETRMLSIAVPTEASHGRQVLTLTISLESVPLQSLELPFQVVPEGK